MCKFCRVGECGLGCLQLRQGFPYHLLGEAGTFTTLTGNAGGFTHFFVAAATFVDRFADLSVGDASAEADIHKGEPSRVYGLSAMDLNVNENDCQSSFVNDQPCIARALTNGFFSV